MKYINKQIALEPQTLAIYRNTTPNATYLGFGDTGSVLKNALLIEQGYLCAYCMKKLPDSNFVSVEHYIAREKHISSPFTQSKHDKKSLLFTNMLGVCKNNGIHCDKKRGNVSLKILNPHDKNCETLVQYTLDGRIKVENNGKVKFDADLLQLNCQIVKDSREHFWEEAKAKLIAKYPKVTWTKKILETEKQIYISKSNGKFKAYCNYIIFKFNHLLNQPKYN